MMGICGVVGGGAEGEGHAREREVLNRVLRGEGSFGREKGNVGSVGGSVEGGKYWSGECWSGRGSVSKGKESVGEEKGIFVGRKK